MIVPGRGRLVAGSVAVGLVLVGCSGPGGPGASASATPPPYHGVVPDQVAQRPSFTLNDTSGRRFDFAAETKGRPTLVYFGYTNCPDECPTAMADAAAALRQLPAELAKEVRVVFVTTDPARDTGPVLRRFLDQFNTDFIGLTGTVAEVEAAQGSARVPLAKKEGPLPTISGDPSQHEHKAGTAPHTHAGPLGYSVGHVNLILAYDYRDKLAVAYPGGVIPSDIAADFAYLFQPA